MTDEKPVAPAPEEAGDVAEPGSDAAADALAEYLDELTATKQMADEFFGAFAARVGNAPVAKVEATPPGVDDQQPVVADLIKDPVVTAEAASV